MSFSTISRYVSTAQQQGERGLDCGQTAAGRGASSPSSLFPPLTGHLLEERHVVDDVPVEHDVELGAHVGRQVSEQLARRLGERPRVLVVLRDEALEEARDVARSQEAADAVQLRALLRRLRVGVLDGRGRGADDDLEERGARGVSEAVECERKGEREALA